MRDFKELQSLLLKWLKNYDCRGIEQIRTSCQRLLASFEISDEKIKTRCLYHIFFPLLRYGMVEFSGSGKYRATPPLIIKARDGSSFRFAAVNLDRFQLEKLHDTIPGVEIDIFQTARYCGPLQAVKNFAAKNSIPIQENKIKTILSRFPAILTAVQSFEEHYPDSRDFYFLRDFDWKKTKGETQPGLYKATEEDFSVRYFYCPDKKWRKIPPRETNPDSSYIARCAQDMIEKKRNFTYNYGTKQFIVNNPFSLPILIDRLLRIPSYHMTGGVLEKENLAIYNNIEISCYRQLNRIFCNTVELTNEKPG